MCQTGNSFKEHIILTWEVLTTPQLHRMVCARNKCMKATEADYYEQLSSSFRCVSLDGDADRLVYFSVVPRNSSKIALVDGDKILSLFSLFIKDQLSTLNILQTKYFIFSKEECLNGNTSCWWPCLL